MKFAIVILATCLSVAQVFSAPTEDATSTVPTTTTTAAPNPDEASSTTPTSAATASETNANAAAGVNAAHLANTSFTCYDRQVGYYADTQADCKVYHFCMPGEYDNRQVYQRISYLCLNETVFDQQALDCVNQTATPCQDSPKYYEQSNLILRKAIINQFSSEDASHGNAENAIDHKGEKKEGEKPSEKEKEKEN